jgi:hypothetical protein
MRTSSHTTLSNVFTICVVLLTNLGIEEWPDFAESHYRALARTAQLILVPDRFDGSSASLDRNRSRQG